MKVNEITELKNNQCKIKNECKNIYMNENINRIQHTERDCQRCPRNWNNRSTKKCQVYQELAELKERYGDKLNCLDLCQDPEKHNRYIKLLGLDNGVYNDLKK